MSSIIVRDVEKIFHVEKTVWANELKQKERCVLNNLVRLEGFSEVEDGRIEKKAWGQIVEHLKYWAV